MTERNLRSRPPTFLFVKCTRIAVFRIYSRIYGCQCNGNALQILFGDVFSPKCERNATNSHFQYAFSPISLYSRTCGPLPSGCSRMTKYQYESVLRGRKSLFSNAFGDAYAEDREL